MTENTETITWKAVKDELPDSDMTVLIFQETDQSVWLGYYDEDIFLSMDGMPYPEVTHWADMPFGPAYCLKGAE